MGAGRLPPTSLAWTIWGLGALLYLIGFYQRVAPAVITSELQREFGLTAAGLGNLSAFYFYSYVAVQIPSGLLADRWGPRRLLTSGAALAAAGMLLFGIGRDVAIVNGGRLLVGAGVGVAFVAMLKLASVWLEPRRFTLAAALALATGVLGATFAGAPLRGLVNLFGWREVMLASGVLCALLAVAIWARVRDYPAEMGFVSPAGAPDRGAQSPANVWADMRELLRYRNTWIILAMPGAVTSILLSWSGLWGVPFLVSQHGFNTSGAALMTSLTLVGWSLGGVLIAPLSERMRRRRPLYVASLLAVASCWALLLAAPPLPIALMALLCFALGAAGGAFTIGFAWAKESVPPRYAGTIGGFANVGAMVGPMLGQPLIGLALDGAWQGQTLNGARVYDLAAYRFAFSMLLVWSALSLVLALLARETHCRQTA